MLVFTVSGGIVVCGLVVYLFYVLMRGDEQ